MNCENHEIGMILCSPLPSSQLNYKLSFKIVSTVLWYLWTSDCHRRIHMFAFSKNLKAFCVTTLLSWKCTDENTKMPKHVFPLNEKSRYGNLLIILPNICLLDLLSCGSTQNIVASCICIWRLQFSKAYKLRCMSTAAATWTAQSAVTVSSDLEPQNMVRQLVRTQGNITTNKTEEKRHKILQFYIHISIYVYLSSIYILDVHIYICILVCIQKCRNFLLYFSSVCILDVHMYTYIHRFMCVYKYTNTHVENIAKPCNKLRKGNLAYSSLL